MSEQCKKRMSHGWHLARCTRKATRDGWCAIHHPEAVAARRAKSNARFEAQQLARRDDRNDRARNTVRAFLDYAKGQVPERLRGGLLVTLENWKAET